MMAHHPRAVWLGILIVAVLWTGRPAWAEQFWITWEGDTYPEEDGWERTMYGGGAERWFEDGALVLDGRASTAIVDDYWIQRPLDPEPGELFVMQWRLRVDEVPGVEDPMVAVISDHGILALVYSEDSIFSMGEYIWIDFAPGIFHEYSLTSTDGVTYSLHIDGELVHIGEFDAPASDPGVTWGDAAAGASSLSVWDYVRFGVIPEPFAGACCNDATGACVDDVLEVNCVGPNMRFGPNTFCVDLDPPCGTGGCCFGYTCADTPLSEEDCLAMGGEFLGYGVSCTEALCNCGGSDYRGDANCLGDGVNSYDIDHFIQAIGAPADWIAAHACDLYCANDINCDGAVNAYDIDGFILCVAQGSCDPCP